MSEELETMRKDGQLDEIERPPREEFDSEVHFFAEFDILKCRGLNISEGGVAFRFGKPLTFQMRFIKDGEIHEHRAKLIWAKPAEAPGKVNVGFEFDDYEEIVSESVSS